MASNVPLSHSIGKGNQNRKMSKYATKHSRRCFEVVNPYHCNLCLFTVGPTCLLDRLIHFYIRVNHLKNILDLKCKKENCGTILKVSQSKNFFYIGKLKNCLFIALICKGNNKTSIEICTNATCWGDLTVVSRHQVQKCY